MSNEPVTPAPVAGRIIGPDSAMNVLDEVLRLGREWVQVHEEASTKRTAIQADAEVTIAQIHARRDLFLTYLDRSFDEREQNFEALFARLDEALASSPEAVGAILSSITTLALKSPFADLHDPVALRQKLDDPGAEWAV